MTSSEGGAHSYILCILNLSRFIQTEEYIPYMPNCITAKQKCLFLAIYVNTLTIDRKMTWPMYSMFGCEIRIFSRRPTALHWALLWYKKIHKERIPARAEGVYRGEYFEGEPCLLYENLLEFLSLTFAAPPTPPQGLSTSNMYT